MKRIAILLGAAALVLSIVPSTLAASKPTQTIVQIATANGNFKTLLAAVGCADPAVGTALTGKAPSPSSPRLTPPSSSPASPGQRLHRAPQGDPHQDPAVPRRLGQRPREQGASVRPRQDQTIKTLLGQPVWSLHNGYRFTTSGSVAHIMVKAGLFNITATNGVIHVIDRVLKPAL